MAISVEQRFGVPSSAPFYNDRAFEANVFSQIRRLQFRQFFGQ